MIFHGGSINKLLELIFVIRHVSLLCHLYFMLVRD